MRNEPIMWIDFMTKVMKENAREHREWHRDRSFKYDKPEELSRPATTLCLSTNHLTCKGGEIK